MQLTIRRGLDLSLEGAPVQSISQAPTPSRVALLGLDYLDVHPSVKVGIDDPVLMGQPLFAHRAFPELVFTAPGSGRISQITRGARRSLESIVIALDGGDEQLDHGPVPMSFEPQSVRQRLLATGLWTAIRERPYNRVPRPDQKPRALFVTAMDTNPLAADPAVVLKTREEDFQRGLAALASQVSDGPVYVCIRPGHALSLPVKPNLIRVDVRGPHPAGLPGTHIGLLEPGVSAAYPVWHIGYQDVAAIGHYFHSGRLCTHRIVALGGPGARDPRLLQSRQGADLSTIASREGIGPVNVLSGSVLSGRVARPGTDFLGRYHDQITLMPSSGGMIGGPLTRLKTLLGALSRDLLGGSRAASTSQGRSSGMLPLEIFDDIWPTPAPPAPLLRALLTGDLQVAADLGVRALAEEDMALCAFSCPSRLDYAAALRDILRDIEAAG